MKKQVLVLFISVAVVRCAVFLENAPVTEEQAEEGYSCRSANENLGLMKQDEARSNYKQDFCGQAICSNGQISYETCGSINVEGCNVQPDPSKPFPKCCQEYLCV